MLYLLPPPLRGLLSLFLLVLHSLFWTTPFYVVAVIRVLIPNRSVRRVCLRILTFFAENWIRGFQHILALWHRTEWDVDGLPRLHRDRWYLSIVNHRSWADILVLVRVLGCKGPLMRFFLKQDLIWTPFIGPAMWALDYAFMKRHSREDLERRPELAGQDLATTRRSLRKFSRTPTMVVLFPEGTRFKPERRDAQGSPYRRLLRPKSGGLALTLAALEDRGDTVLDWTLHYPEPRPRFWDFLCGTARKVTVRIREREVPGWIGESDYETDPAYRERFQEWLGAWWEEKDALLNDLAAKDVS